MTRNENVFVIYFRMHFAFDCRRGGEPREQRRARCGGDESRVVHRVDVKNALTSFPMLSLCGFALQRIESNRMFGSLNDAIDRSMQRRQRSEDYRYSTVICT